MVAYKLLTSQARGPWGYFNFPFHILTLFYVPYFFVKVWLVAGLKSCGKAQGLRYILENRGNSEVRVRSITEAQKVEKT